MNTVGKGRFLFRTLNHHRTIISYLLHICAVTSIAIACGYTASALVLMPFSWGAMVGAAFYLALVLVVWD